MRHRKVLLVDDDVNLLRGLVRVLHRQPYELLTARNAEEAMWIFKSQSIDLVVSDEYMPGMKGTDFLTWVSENFPGVVRILLTGQPSVAAAVSAINSGRVYRFLTKPCSDWDLAMTIQAGLEEPAAVG
ncbi:MAG: response regulator [Planctomycetales bacterium]|nr:response regulator [Planctomycetales bacterium]